MRNYFLRLTILLIGLGYITSSRAVIDPQPGDSVWAIIKRLGQEADDYRENVAYIRNTDAVGGTITISSPGHYKFGERITSTILIHSDDVWLDFDSEVLEMPLEILSHQNVRIFNGTIVSPSPSLSDGILINSGASGISIENMRISNWAAGIYADGSVTPVKECEIIECDLVECERGIALVYTHDTVIRNCRAVDCSEDGIYFFNSQNCCVFDSQAISIQGNNTVSGFKSESGQSNLFEGCVSKNIITEASEYVTRSYGFLFSGAEERSKIIDCIVNEVDMTSTNSAVAYGIQLNPEILPYPGSLLSEITTKYLPGYSVKAIAWSPCTRYLAMAFSGFLSVYEFDGSELNLVSIFDASSTIKSIDWSPNGKWIALGSTFGSVGYTKVVEFENKTITELANVGGLSTTVDVVKWSPDNKFLAVGLGGGARQVSVYYFNGSSLTETATGTDGPTNGSITSLSWSPDGHYICVSSIGDTTAAIYIYEYFGASLVWVPSTNLAATSPKCVSWSPNGRFIALADDDRVSVLSFDGTTLYEYAYDEIAGAADFLYVDWSPNGEYIVSADYYSANSTVRVLPFDGTTNFQFVNWFKTISGDFNSFYGVSWSSCGRYIAACSENNNAYVLNAMAGPDHCLVQDCKVCDVVSFAAFYGVGIAGGGTNSFLNNSCCHNEVNYSWGIPNVYYRSPDEQAPFINIAKPYLP